MTEASGRPRALPYGLGWNDLRPCLPEFGASARGARAWVAHEKQGLNGGDTSCILSLGYPTPSGPERTVTVFVKRAADPAKAEARRYRFLERRGIPVPRLLTSVDTEQGEVVVLEFLPAIGPRAKDADDLLRLVARLNAVAHPPADLFASAPGMPVDVFDANVVTAIAVLAEDRTVADVVDMTAWFDAYKAAEQTVERQPIALNHGELAFQQVGRSATGRLVLFDLETMAVLPRFTDVAAILGGLARLTSRDQRELFGHYLGDLASLTGTTLPEDAAWTELLAVRVVSSLQSLPWLIEMAGNPHVGFDPTSFVLALATDLAELAQRR